MKVIGLTGGIGSGKTTIAKMFANLGVPVYYADDEAKKLMYSNQHIKEQLIRLFGEDTFLNGELNKAFIADIIFKDKKKLESINAIVHPEVEKHFSNWIKKQDSKYVIQENAILFESGTQNRFDKIITVTAPLGIKIERVVERDQTSREKVLERIDNQLKDDYKIRNSSFVINNLSLEDSKKEVIKIHKLLNE